MGGCVLHEVLNSVLQRVSYYCIWYLVSDARDLMCERVLRAKVTLLCICMFEGLSVIVCNQDMKLHIIVKIRVLSEI